MPYRELHYHWVYDLKSAAEKLWPFVADTNRFNHDTNVPAVEVESTRRRLRNARRQVRLSIFGMPVEWEEQPFEWVRPSRFGVKRANDVIISRSLYDDPEVRELIGDENLQATPFEIALKGFQEERFELWRISKRLAADSRG